MGLSVTFGKALGWLAWVGLVPALLMLFSLCPRVPEKGGCRLLWREGFWFFLPMELVVYHWFFYLYPLSFTGMAAWEALIVVLLAWLGVSAFQTVGMALIFPAFGLFCWKIRLRAAFWRPLILAAMWVVAEWCQTLFWFGVPWGRLALSQVYYGPMVQSVSVWGCLGLTFCVVAVNGYLALAVWEPVRWQRRGLTALCVFGGNLLLGLVMTWVAVHSPADGTWRVAAVQGNFSSGRKWSATAYETWNRYDRLTDQALAELGGEADLVVWPETAMPFVLEDYPRYASRVSHEASEGTVRLMTGTFVRDDFGAEHSSVLTFEPDGTQSEVVYHKRRLVPFGEFVPLRGLVTALVPPLAELNLWEDSLTPGQEATVLETGDGGVGFLICFDSVYAALARDTVKNRAQVLVLPTNDSWFFDSPAIYMHLGQARLRAMETGRSVVRAANTGVSALITPTGKLTAYLGPSVQGYVTGEVSLYSYLTAYTVLGDWPVWVCLSALMAPVLMKIVDLVYGFFVDKRLRKWYNK